MKKGTQQFCAQGVSKKANLFKTPIEETIHRIVRPKTEKEIIKELNAKKPEKLLQLNAIKNSYMEIEEALAGSLAELVLDELIAEYKINISQKDRESALEEILVNPQYRLLRKGMAFAQENGFEKTYSIYMQEGPQKYRQLIIK